jgi:hypothetical protein
VCCLCLQLPSISLEDACGFPVFSASSAHYATTEVLLSTLAVLAGSRRSTITKDTVPTAAAAGVQRPRKSSASGAASVCSGATGQTQLQTQQQQQQQRDYVREQREAKELQQRRELSGSPLGGCWAVDSASSRLPLNALSTSCASALFVQIQGCRCFVCCCFVHP